jgi:hypothetical protein
MEVIWGSVLVVLGLLAWGGQSISLMDPTRAARWNLTEAEEKVEPAYWADIRGEALWDFYTLWTLPVAGILLILDAASWTSFGLVGGGVYVYFAGRGILTRLELQRRGFRIGDPANVRLGLVMLGVWGLVGLTTVIAALVW